MVVGFVEDKDLSKVLPLLPKDAYYFFTRAAIRRALDEKEKTREIVRLLGGDGEEEFALKHAEELVRQAKQYKEAIN